MVNNEGYSFPFPSHLSTGAIPVIVAFFSWIISCYFDWVKRNIRLNLIEGTKTACNNLITCSCYIYLCYYFREMSVDSHANLVRSKEPIIDQGYAITACCSIFVVLWKVGHPRKIIMQVRLAVCGSPRSVLNLFPTEKGLYRDYLSFKTWTYQ